MIEFSWLTKNPPKPFQENGITADSFKVLDSPKFQFEANEVEAKKQEVLATIKAVGEEKLVTIFNISLDQLASNDPRLKPEHKNNQRVINVLFNAARFIRDIDKTLLSKIEETIESKYLPFIEEQKTILSDKNLEQIKGYLVTETVLSAKDPDVKNLSLDQITAKVGGFAKTLKDRAENDSLT